MADQSDSDKQKKGKIAKVITILCKPSVSYSLGGILITGVLAGIIFWGGFNTVLEMTNTEQFCLSCHEMRDNVYPEYQQTIHYKNNSGVRATCSDCHVPRDWGHKMVRKVKASRELWGKLVGTINTAEKFETKRLHLARREWARMEQADSRECRNCHSMESMDLEAQPQRARRQHQMAKEDNMTCINCHKGIAHQLPKDMTEEDWE